MIIDWNIFQKCTNIRILNCKNLLRSPSQIYDSLFVHSTILLSIHFHRTIYSVLTIFRNHLRSLQKHQRHRDIASSQEKSNVISFLSLFPFKERESGKVVEIGKASNDDLLLRAVRIVARIDDGQFHRSSIPLFLSIISSRTPYVEHVENKTISSRWNDRSALHFPRYYVRKRNEVAASICWIETKRNVKI